MVLISNIVFIFHILLFIVLLDYVLWPANCVGIRQRLHRAIRGGCGRIRFELGFAEQTLFSESGQDLFGCSAFTVGHRNKLIVENFHQN